MAQIQRLGRRDSSSVWGFGGDFVAVLERWPGWHVDIQPATPAFVISMASP